MYNFITKRLNQIPNQVRNFFYKAIALLIIWKLIYIFLLLPHRIIDRPLTQIVGTGTVLIANLIENTEDYSSRIIKAKVIRDNQEILVNQAAIYVKNDKLLGIEDACNGLELFVLYAGFIFCLPALASRKLIFIFSGMLLIFLANILRCVGLLYVIEYYPDYISFTHHYLFTFIVYSFIIWLWLLFSKKLTIENEAV